MVFTLFSVNVQSECTHSLARYHVQGTYTYGVKHYGDKMHLLFPTEIFIIAPGPDTAMATYLRTVNISQHPLIVNFFPKNITCINVHR